MTRQQKQNLLAVNARALASAIQAGIKPFFGNKGVTLTRNGVAGDIIGYLLVQTGVAPKVHIDETDPNVVLALTLGTTVYALPEKLQQAVINLALAADDTKRSYARRRPKLVKLLNALATELESNVVVSPSALAPVAVNVTAARITLPGKSI